MFESFEHHATIAQALAAVRFQARVSPLMLYFTKPSQVFTDRALEALVEWVEAQDLSFLTDDGRAGVALALEEAKAAINLSMSGRRER